MKAIWPAGTRSSMKLEESTRFCSKIEVKTHYKQFGGSLWFWKNLASLCCVCFAELQIRLQKATNNFTVCTMTKLSIVLTSRRYQPQWGGWNPHLHSMDPQKL
jgi:hypothetical protein